MIKTAAIGFLASILADGMIARAAEESPQAKWEAEIKSANEAWAGKRLAILKIDDAVYLKDGQTAFLMMFQAGYKWSLTAPAGLVPNVQFKGGKALFWHPGAKTQVDLLSSKDPVTLSPKVDIKAQLAQIEPGVEGLRVSVYNQDNPAPSAFKGVEYFPYTAAFSVRARFEAAPELKAEDFETSRGWSKRFYKAGEAVFSLAGREQRLPFYVGEKDPAKIKEMSAFFLDGLTGKETYGVGRYIDIPVTGFPPKEILIDLNFAYNPNCARSPHYNCPQAKVTLNADVRAGEKRPSTAK